MAGAYRFYIYIYIYIYIPAACSVKDAPIGCFTTVGVFFLAHGSLFSISSEAEEDCQRPLCWIVVRLLVGFTFSMYRQVATVLYNAQTILLSIL